jgi:hypothetical protein
MHDWESMSHVRWECKLCGIHTKVPSQGVLWKGAKSDWSNPVRFVSAKGIGVDRREIGGRPNSHLGECAAEVQHSDDDRISEREECDPDSSRVAGS